MSSSSNVKVDACPGWTTNLGQLIRQWWTSSLPLASTYQLFTSSMWRISTWTTWGSLLASVRFLTLFFSTSAASGKTLCRYIRYVSWTPVNLREDWDQYRAFDRRKPLSESVRKLQLVSFQILPQQLRTFLDLFKGLQVLEGKWFPSNFFTQVLEMDVCDLEMDSMKAVLLNQPLLHTFRCPAWLHTSPLNLANLQLTFRHVLPQTVFLIYRILFFLFRHCSLQLSKQSIVVEEDRLVKYSVLRWKQYFQIPDPCCQPAGGLCRFPM